jgi:hypothetical protein
MLLELFEQKVVAHKTLKKQYQQVTESVECAGEARRNQISARVVFRMHGCEIARRTHPFRSRDPFACLGRGRGQRERTHRSEAPGDRAH